MTKKHLVATLIVLALVALGGCRGKQVKSGSSSSPGEPVGPPLPPTTESEIGPEAPLGPFPSADFTPPKDGYVLVLGPGLARGMAYLGVLRELEERHVPISAVMGVEIGSVVAAIWSGSNINNLEWEMHKFNRGTLMDVPLLKFGRRIAEGKRLYKFLDEALKVNLLQKMKVPTFVFSAVRGSGGASLVFENSGSAKDIVRGAMGIPGLIKAYSWDGKERETAAIEEPFPAVQAKALGLGKVLCVDVVGRGDNFEPKEAVEEQLATLMRSVGVLARQKEKDCDVTLSIPTDGIGYLNFDAKADLIYQGKVAVQKWLERK
jgi:NTE family protein